MSTAPPTADPEVGAGVRATYAAFISTGFAFASWASRIPQVRDELHLEPSQLGLVLLAIAAGSLIALPSSGALVSRWGSRRVVSGMARLNGFGLAVVAVGYDFGVVWVVLGLFFFGFAQGAWDVAMNVQGALVERRLGKAIMPRFHAGFSVGTVAGALSGAAMVALHIPVTAHLLVVGVLVALLVPVLVRRFIPDSSAHAGDESVSKGSTLRAWRERRTLLIGVFVLAFAFAEGTGNDWTSIALIDGYATSAFVGTLGFAVFLAAMTAGRWFGPAWLDRWGRVVVMRVMTVVSLAGVLVFVFGGVTWVAFVGAVLWGAGLSLGFPVGMSAGADEPAMAAPRVSVIASIGYCAFLTGPPVVGFLGDHLTVLRSVTAVAVLLALAFLLAGQAEPAHSNPTDSA
ncbi:MFS transporter [Lapillicoccus sp.]|uniref:MFS transporter n=1 Tax=Lapillicoccus sp. TaxID=1909287 RepID=UPI0027C1EE1E|nr:MFS transporter [Actinomycetota bacterium]